MKEIREKIANYTTNTVNSENIESIVNSNEEFELGNIIASERANHTENNCRPWRNVTGGGSNCDKTGDGTRAPTDDTPFVFETVINQNPSKSANGSRKIGDDTSHGGSEIAAKTAAAVESEPTEPQEDCSENDVSDIVGTIVELLGSVAATFSQNNRVCKGGSPGRDVDGSATCEIETTQDEDPTIGVPGPARNGIIDNGCPDKDEDTAWEHASSLCCGANSKRGCNCSEHTLENSEGKIRNIACLLSQHTSETDVVKVANERAGRPGECEWVSPEKPLIVSNVIASPFHTWNDTIAIDMRESQMSESADFLLARPE